MLRTLWVLLAAVWLVTPARTSHADIDLWPLLEITDDSTTVLYPLFVHEGPFMMIFPLYYRTNAGSDHHLVWPFFKISEGRLARIFPLWFSKEEGHYTVFPIARWTPDIVMWPLPPTYMRRDGRFTLVLPLYLKNDDTEVVPPTLYRVKHLGQLKRAGLWPITDLTVHPDRKELSFVRFIRTAWGEDLFKFSLWPLITWSSKQEHRSFWLLPFYYQRAPGQAETALYPLFAHWRDDESSGLWIIPYLHAESSLGYKTAVLGLLDVRRRLIPGTDEVQSKLTLLGFKSFSFYRRQSFETSDGRLIERTRRLLFFSEEEKASGERTFKFFGIPLFSRSGTPEPSAEEEPVSHP